MNVFKSEIIGHLDIIILENEDELEGEITKWKEVSIHGDPEGLRSLGNLLLRLADLDQHIDSQLPAGARSHIHLRPGFELSNSSEEVIVGRLDAKGTGLFYDKYISKDNSK